MVRTRQIRVHPEFEDALNQMRRDLARIEKHVFQNPELTRRIAIRMKARRSDFARQNKWDW